MQIPMKILHLVHQYLPEQVGGTEFYTQWVAHRLAKRGHRIDIFYRRYAEGSGYEFRVDADDVRVWAAWSGPMSTNGRFMATFKEAVIFDAFCRVVEQVRPDIVHIQHLMGLPVAVADYLQQHNIPFVITLHDYWWVCANAQLLTNYSRQICDGPQGYLNCARCALARAGHPHLWPAIPVLAGPLAWRNHLLRRVLDGACKLIPPSKFVGDWYAAYGVPVEKIQVIPHGLDSPPPHFCPVQDSDRAIRFAFIGGLSWQKGVHILLEAFQTIDTEAELWIAGNEQAEPDYVTNLRGLTSTGVLFLGKLTREAVWETLAQVDVVVVPALWYESFSFIISEAFASGTPVIASRLGPLADRVSDEVNGLLVPPDNPLALRKAIMRFLEDPTLLSRLQAGIPPVRTLDDHVSDLESVYEAALHEA